MASSNQCVSADHAHELLRNLHSCESTIEEIIQITKTPNVTLGIVHGGNIIHRRSYGLSDVSLDVSCNNDTPFAISSLTKAFTATACALLALDGALDWDKPIQHYLPAFRPQMAPRIADSATVRDVLNHLTGLPDPYSLYTGFHGKLRLRDDNSLFNLINHLQASDKDLKNMWMYNSLVYALLGPLIETISGVSFPDFMKNRIFDPLGFANTLVLTRDSKARQSGSKQAKPYIVFADDSLRELPVIVFDENAFAASFGLVSSVNDLLLWSTAVLEALQVGSTTATHRSRHQIMAAIRRTFESACQIKTLDDGIMTYRSGWFHTTGRAISFDIFYDPTVGNSSGCQKDCSTTKWSNEHSGSNSTDQPDNYEPGSRSILYSNGYIKGFTSNIYVFPDLGHAFVVLGNSTGRSEPCGYISRLLAALVCGDKIPDDVISTLNDEVKEFAGRWKSLATALGVDAGGNSVIRYSTAAKLTGRYINTETGLIIVIERYRNGNEAQHLFPHKEVRHIGFSFGGQEEIQLPLWHYGNDVLCFFPSEEEFERVIMPPYADASQYLLHMHTDAERDIVTGLWWQYDRAFDGIWFSREAVRDS